MGHYWLGNFRSVGISVFYKAACSYNIIFLRIDYFFVMCINHVFHIGHAAVTYFKVAFIEQLVKFLVLREVLIN